MSERVENLSSSVEELYINTPECYSPLISQDHLYYRLRQEKMQLQRSHSIQNNPQSVSTAGLQSISESVNESSDSEFEEDECVSFRATGDLRRPTQRSRPSSYASISKEPEEPTPEPVYVDDNANTKDYCLLNNTSKPTKAKSMSQLPNVIRNDLTRHTDPSSSKRHSVISIMSDSVLVTQRHWPSLHPALLKEHEL